MLHPLQFANGNVVSLVEDCDLLSEFLAHETNEKTVEKVLAHLDSVGEHLRDENVFKAIDRKAGKGIRLSEDQATATKIGVSHYRLAVFDRPTELSFPKRLVKAVVGVLGNDSNADL